MGRNAFNVTTVIEKYEMGAHVQLERCSNSPRLAETPERGNMLYIALVSNCHQKRKCAFKVVRYFLSPWCEH